MLKEIIAKLKESTNLPVKPFGTKEIENCIVYTYNPSSDNGALSQSRLELRLITKDIETAETYKKLIINTLVTVGDEQKIDGIYQCNLNGGGQLRDDNTKTIHTLLYFDILTRSQSEFN